MTVRTVANRYELEEEIGRGGMAVVYRALDLRLNRHVALKLLHPFLATQAESAARFLREAEAIAKLHHPNIVEIFDTGHDEETGSQFLVMELIEGPTLNTFIGQTPTLIPEIAIAMGCSICDAIEHAHNSNIIHRDIKPENIMFSKDGTLKLMDFGIARILDADRMTASGSLIGSPAHMSPEIIEGHKYSFTCDIFSLGTVLYFALTNRLPFSGTTPMAVFKAILDNTYTPPGRLNQAISRKMDKLVAKCLKTNPEERFQSAAELREALLALLKPLKLDNYSAVIAEYYASPNAFQENHLPEIKTILTTAAQTDIHNRKVPAALEKLNIVLNYDPENQQAIALLKKLRTGNMIKKRSVLIAAIVTAVAVVVTLCLIHPWKSNDLPANSSTAPILTPPQLAVSNHDSEQLEQTENSRSPDVVPTAQEMPASDLTTDEVPKEFDQDNGMLENIPEPENNIDNTLEPEKNIDNTLETEKNIDNTPDAQEAEDKTPDAKADNINPETTDTETTRREKHSHTQTPKKIHKTDSSQSTPQTTSTSNPQSASPIPPSIAMVQVRQPVFPPDAYAFIGGKRYNADANGDINLQLAPGRYAMTVTCKTRCVSQKSTLVVSGNTKQSVQEVITLDWADASITVNSQNKNLYFVSVLVDEHGKFTQQIDYLMAGKPKNYNGFNPLGNKPIRLEIYAIAKSKQLTGMTKAILEKEKSASTRVELLPGDTRTIAF